MDFFGGCCCVFFSSSRCTVFSSEVTYPFLRKSAALQLLRCPSSLFWPVAKHHGPSAAELLFWARLSCRVSTSGLSLQLEQDFFLYIYRIWKIKWACKKDSTVIHSHQNISMCLFTLGSLSLCRAKLTSKIKDRWSEMWIRTACSSALFSIEHINGCSINGNDFGDVMIDVSWIRM